MQSTLCTHSSNVAERITSFYIAVMLFVFPLFTGFSGYANVTFSKYMFFVIITLIWLVSLLFFFVAKKISVSIKFWIWFPCVAFILICTISAIVSDHFPQTIIGASRYDGLVTQFLCACIFLGIASFGKLETYHLRLCGLGASICCIIAVFQLFNINIFGLFPYNYSYYDAHIKYTGEFLGTLGNVDILGAYLCMCVPMFFSVLMQPKSRFDTLYVIPLFLSIFTLTSAATAASFVALGGWALIFIPALCRTLAKLGRALMLSAVILLAVALAFSFNGSINEGSFSFSFVLSGYVVVITGLAFICVAAALILIKCFGNYEYSPRAIIYHGVATAICLALIYVWGYDGTKGTLYEFSQVLHGNFEDSFGSSRILIWRNVLNVIPDKPILGHGPDTLPLVIDINFTRYVPQTGKTLSTFVDNAHNIYLGYLAGIGAIGLTAFLTTVISALINVRRSKHFTVLAGSVAAYLIHSFFGLGICLISPVFWLLLGLCAANNNNVSLEA